MRYIIFGFKGTIAAKIAKQLATYGDVVLLESSLPAIKHFAQTINFKSYDRILGLGAYSGKDKNELRIETTCSSQFRNNKTNLHRHKLPYFMQPAEGIKTAGGIGNSWCNVVCYALVTEVPNAHFTFLHVPKNFDIQRAVKIIAAQL